MPRKHVGTPPPRTVIGDPSPADGPGRNCWVSFSDLRSLCRPQNDAGTAFTSFLDLLRARADGRQAVVGALLPGRPPTRWVAPKAIRTTAFTSFLDLLRARADGRQAV